MRICSRRRSALRPTPWPPGCTSPTRASRGPGDLARRLVAAEAALTPRNRARRERAGVQPLVDALDLPVEAGYLAQLRTAGLSPFAVSRWFNRAAIRVPAGELPRAAAFGFVSRLAPVEKAIVMHDPPATRDALPWSDALGGAEALAVTSVNYGVKLKELQQLNLPALHDSGYTGQGRARLRARRRLLSPGRAPRDEGDRRAAGLPA
jgi:hypothetical protein